ncbi:MAG: hypothetical protein OEY47_04465, partial [Candidatus Bathyarchaeota archaeon]|nr:hypothetical protein [Candidatus Bathyarchaeota archaeon]
MRHGLFRKISAMGILILIFGTVWLTSLSGNISVVAVGVTVYVDDDNIGGPWDGTLDYPYQNITSGLEHASNGDTVYVLNGTYDENVVIDKSVALKGDSKPVIDGMGGMGARGIDITANNVTVEGFNITNSVFGIYCNASGFSIINNIFWYDHQGFYWRIQESYLAADYTVYGGVVENNEFYMSSANDAVHAYVALNYNYTGFYDVEIGDIQICNNTFYMEGTIAMGIDVDGFYVECLYGGTVSFGVFNMSENTIFGGEVGIDFYGNLEELKDVQASVGDVIIKNNVMVNQSSCGMYVDYYDGTYWYGNTVGTYGNLIITGNTITSVYGADGIYLSDIGYWYDFHGNASLEVGNVYIEENEIDVGGDGIYFYGYDVGYDMYDNSSFTIGHISVKNNIINSGSDGIYVDFYEFGYYMY